MLNIRRALNSSRLIKALTGLTAPEFNSLLLSFATVLQASREQSSQPRQRAPGGGSKPTLLSAADKLFFILFYCKCYPTFDVAGFFFNVDRAQTNRWMHELLPRLEQALGQKLVLPERKIHKVEEFLERFPARQGHLDRWHRTSGSATAR